MPAEVWEWDYGGRRVRSERCGGAFSIAHDLLGWLGNVAPSAKAQLTSWILERIVFTEDEWPAVTADVIEAAIERKPIPFVQKCDRLLELLISVGNRPGQPIPWAAGGAVNPQSEVARQQACAWAETTSDQELYALNRQMVQLGYFSEANGRYAVAADGFRRMDELRQSAPPTDQVFMAMWFNNATDEAYEDGIAKGIRDAGYRPMRIDRKEHANRIDDEIIAEIRRSRFLIADFTCEVLDSDDGPVGVARGGVYYEAGFAQGLGTPVIWTVGEDQIELIHFDTRQYNHITWATPPELREKLYHRIGAMFGHRAGAPGLGAG